MELPGKGGKSACLPSERPVAESRSSSNLRGVLQKTPAAPTVTPTLANPAREGRVLILPAIDIRGGQCVRLRQGDYERETVFGADPAAMARGWVEQGATFLHLVDLDGAREGRPVNEESIRRIVETAG